MRWPEKTRRKRWPTLFYSLEVIAAGARTIGIALFVIVLLLQLKPWLETGIWPDTPVRVFLVDILHIPFFEQLTASFASDPTGTDINLFELIVRLFIEKFPLSFFFLIVGKVISMYIYWMVDHVFPETQVEVNKGFVQQGKKIVNIK